MGLFIFTIQGNLFLVHFKLNLEYDRSDSFPHLIMNPTTEYRRVQNQKENSRYYRIPFNLKWTRKRIISLSMPCTHSYDDLIKLRASLCSRSWENHSDQSMAIRETSVSRHHGGRIEGSPKTPVHHSIVLRGSREAFNWAPMMPRDVSLPEDSDYKFLFIQATFCIIILDIFLMSDWLTKLSM